MDKFLILGSSSRLASEIKQIFPSETIFLNKNDCDVTNEKCVLDIFQRYTFKYIINCAALTDINYCEDHQKECFDINTLAVFYLNNLCKKNKKKLIHISSDYAVNPINIYGASKYLSEKLIDKDFLIIRTNFYDKQTYLLKSLLKKNKTDVYKNMYFNPVSVTRLVREIYNNKDEKGILNIFSNKEINYVTFSKFVCQNFNIPTSFIREIDYVNKKPPYRPLSSYVKPDINVDINNDLRSFKESYDN